MQRGADAPLPDDEFNSLALRVFEFQFERNTAFRRYCERRGASPGIIDHWSHVPPVPTVAFKEIPLVAGLPADAQLVFRTSGTTRGAARRGTHYITDASLYRESLLATFRSFVLTSHARMRMFSLVPEWSDVPDSSLSYMVSAVLKELGGDGSMSFATVGGGLDVAGLDRALQQTDEAVCVLGTSLALLHWLERSDLHLVLPSGSRIMDTGGFKGEQREIAAADLRRL
ncbi:MAG TPA: hypothetical protein VF021_04645, partial [Longimicrobiales bacterium]